MFAPAQELFTLVPAVNSLCSTVDEVLTEPTGDNNSTNANANASSSVTDPHRCCCISLRLLELFRLCRQTVVDFDFSLEESTPVRLWRYFSFSFEPLFVFLSSICYSEHDQFCSILWSGRSVGFLLYHWHIDPKIFSTSTAMWKNN